MENSNEKLFDNNEISEFSDKEIMINQPKGLEVEGLYHIAVTLAEFRGYKNVDLNIFRANTNEVPFNPEKYVPDCIPKDLLKEKPSYVLEYLKESFTIQEIQQIKEYFSKFGNISIGKQFPCSLPEDGNILPTSAIPFDGNDFPNGFIDFYKTPDYSLPFDVTGHYNLQACEINKRGD